MLKLSSKAFELLRRFQLSSGHTLTVTELRTLMPEDELDYRLRELADHSLIEVSELSDPSVESGIFFSGSPCAYRLTVAGWDYLLSRYQEDQEKAYQERIKKQDEAKSKKDKVKDRVHDYLVAIVGAIVGSSVTLLVEHFDQVAAWLNSLFH